MLEPKWKLFEQAVAAFLDRLAPGARVTSNAYRPDADTGRNRQRDVWIEASVGGLIPVTILVSCKRYKRKVDQQQLDAFLGEWRSSRAHVGVIYSFSGFTEPALEKARANGDSCCRLYLDEPPDIPDLLLFTCYLWQPMVHVEVLEGLGEQPRLRWLDLFEVRDAEGSLLDQLEEAWGVASESARKAIADGTAKPNLISTVRMGFDAVGDYSAFRLQVVHRWRLFRARETAHSVNGSYSESDRRFIGSVMSPSIDTWSSEPGPGWEEIPAHQQLDGNAAHLISTSPPLRQALVDRLGPQLVFRQAGS